MTSAKLLVKIDWSKSPPKITNLTDINYKLEDIYLEHQGKKVYYNQRNPVKNNLIYEDVDGIFNFSSGAAKIDEKSSSCNIV